MTVFFYISSDYIVVVFYIFLVKILKCIIIEFFDSQLIIKTKNIQFLGIIKKVLRLNNYYKIKFLQSNHNKHKKTTSKYICFM